MLYLEHQEELNDMNHISSGPIWWADSESEEGYLHIWPVALDTAISAF